MPMTEKNREKLERYLDTLYEERPNSSEGVKFSIQEQKRVVRAIFDAGTEGVTNFADIHAQYYGLGGVGLAKAYEYAKVFGRRTGCFSFDGGYTVKHLADQSVINGKLLEYDERVKREPKEKQGS